MCEHVFAGCRLALVLVGVWCTCVSDRLPSRLLLPAHVRAGVRRSHSCSLQLPLQQPASVAATALALPGGGVAVHVTVALDAAADSSLVLLQAALQPQYGLMLGSSSGTGPCASQVLPMRLAPGSSGGLSFLLSHDPGACGAAHRHTVHCAIAGFCCSLAPAADADAAGALLLLLLFAARAAQVTR